MDHLQPPQTPDTPPRPPTTLQSPTRLAPKTPVDRGRRPPRLVLPPPNSPPINNASLTSKSSYNPNGNPYVYPNRKESEFVLGLKGFAKSGLSVGEKSTYWIYNKLYGLSRKWFTHCFLSIVLALYTVGGAAIFVYVEGDQGEDVIVRDTVEARYEVIDQFLELYVRPRRTDDDEWRGKAARKLEEYEDFVIANFRNRMFIHDNRGNRTWTLFNAVVYCSTIFTTIGYGHMYPTTTTGQALTIVYALIGIPLFLIALTDFGKLFTRCIKFLWSYVRRLYYTGSCRSVRKTTHVEDILQGAQIMYEVATLRRPSIFAPNVQPDPENPKEKDGRSINSATIGTDTPTTPAPSNFEIDDEFNLPISVAIFISVLYIFLGALMYCWFEKWDFFASFYFVFISMSTIGFGDYVPKHPLGVVLSIVYLVFGLALMSMCINVVQVKLSDTFKDASSKLGATIGLNVEDDGSITTVAASPVEVPEVHVSGDKEETNGKDKKNDKNGKKEKKSSLKISKSKEEKQDEEEEPKPPKEVKF